MADVQIFSRNQTGVDFFGFGKIANGYFEYQKFKILVTNENKETLYHIVKKDILTSQVKTKELIDKILTMYQDKKNISMQVIKILDFLDDEILNAILNIEIEIKGKFFDNIVKNGSPDDKFCSVLLRNGLLQAITLNTGIIGVNMREEYGDYDGTVCFDDANVEYCLLIPESIIKIREIYQNEQ